MKGYITLHNGTADPISVKADAVVVVGNGWVRIGEGSFDVQETREEVLKMLTPRLA